MSVGHSDHRTPAKHAFLNAVVGAEIGAAQHAARRMRVTYNRHWFIDLTAGDGVAYHGEGLWHRACSPGILAHHAQWQGCPVPVRVLLVERAAETFESLLANLALNLPDLGYERTDDFTWKHRERPVHLEAQLGDGRQCSPELLPGDFVFVNNDPNKIHDWAMPETAFSTAVFRGAVVRSFNTMGCNVSGLKRMYFEGGRDAWYSHVNTVVGAVSRSQDLVLFAINKDDAQWGYLIVTPTVWAERDAAAAQKAFGKHGMGVTAVSLRADRARFLDLLDRLFLTAKELRERDEDQLW